MKNPLIRLIWLLTLLACIPLTVEAGIQSRNADSDFAPLSAPLARGAKIALRDIAVGDRTQTLEVERFEVWAPNARIDVIGEGGAITHLAPPDIQYFRGIVAGEPDSLVFLSIGREQGVSGFILANERRYSVASRFVRASRGAVAERAVFIDEMDVLDDYAPGGFHCGVEGKTVTLPRTASTLREDAGMAIQPQGTLSGTGLWTLHLAIDTDFELYGDFGSNSTTVTTFIGNVVGASSTIYQRDVRTELLIAYSRVHTTAADPFNIVPGASGLWNGATVTYTTGHALAELGDVWHNSPPFAGSRSDVLLLSGKSQTAGTAWIGTTCGGDFLCSGGNCGSAMYDGHYGGGYAYCGLGNPSTTVPNPNDTNNGVQYGLPATNYWPILVLAHELGHNVSSPHTHCVSLSAGEKSAWGVTRNFVDECVSSGGACFTGTTSIPAEKGSIMSYCHLSGASQSRFLFGKTTEPTQKMVDTITAFINARTPASPSISAPANMAPGSSSNASINSPVGGQTYVWTATNATINGSNTGTTINFTANVNPVTLRARTTNASGCAATDFVTITVSCSPSSIVTPPQSASVTAGSNYTLSVVANGSPTSYQWYIGASGNTSAPTGTSSSSLTVTPSTTTSWWVRVTNSCGSVDSATATVTVVQPGAVATSFYTMTPCRLLDTRNPNGPLGGPAIPMNGERVFQASGTCGIPSSAKSLAINVSVVGPPAVGFLTLYPSDSPRPGTSTINYSTGKTRANNAILSLSSTGQFTIFNFNAVGATHALVDVVGYFE